MSTEQDKALRAMVAWSKTAEESFVLSGFAGTGKSTVLQEFINSRSSETLCLAPTGKAAMVLGKRLERAVVSTIHHALYTPVPSSMVKLRSLEAALLKNPSDEKVANQLRAERLRLSKTDVKFSPKQDVKIQRGQIVVVDEASMVTRAMRNDLQATGAKVLYVGDPGQLPPVKDKGFFQTTRPDAMLEEVQRQAFNSPIIRLSMAIRAGEPIGKLNEEGCRRIPKEDLEPEEWISHDQVLTGSNAVRRKLNKFFRKTLGHEGWIPRKGEKLVFLKNHFGEEVQVVNGELAEAGNDFLQVDDHLLTGEVKLEAGRTISVMVDQHPFMEHYEESMPDPTIDFDEVRSMDYAYSLTVHKSQGSEWGSVILADDEIMRSDREFRKRWLYTAVTRARESLTWLY